VDVARLDKERKATQHTLAVGAYPTKVLWLGFCNFVVLGEYNMLCV